MNWVLGGLLVAVIAVFAVWIVVDVRQMRQMRRVFDRLAEFDRSTARFWTDVANRRGLARCRRCGSEDVEYLGPPEGPRVEDGSP